MTHCPLHIKYSNDRVRRNKWTQDKGKSQVEFGVTVDTIIATQNITMQGGDYHCVLATNTVTGRSYFSLLGNCA